MSDQKRLFALISGIAVSLLAAGAANAQNPPKDASCDYTVASLEGSYSVLANYGANVALGLWAETLDGKGNLVRTGILNEPTSGSTTGARTLVVVSSVGTYTVNCNGTGTMVRTVTLPNGGTTSETDDFIITGATEGSGRILVATTIADATRVPSAIVAGGIFVTHVHTRLPDMDSSGK